MNEKFSFNNNTPIIMGIIMDILLAIVLGVMPIFCDPVAYKLKVKTNNIPTTIDNTKKTKRKPRKKKV